MTENNAQKQTGEPNANWEAEKAKYEEQLRALSAERNSYRQTAEAWRKVGSELGDSVKYDSVTGMPIGVDYGNNQQTPPVYNGAHPFSGVVDNPQAVDQYYQSLVNQQLQQAGYVTPQQAQQLMNQAYQAATGAFMVARNYDKLTANEKYAPLSDYSSDMSKRTARILEERNLGKPLEGAKGFDQWNYSGIEALQFGADMARLEMIEESQKSADSQNQAQDNQQRAGLSIPTEGGSATPPQQAAGEPPMTQDGNIDWERMNQDTQQRAEKLGVQWP